MAASAVSAARGIMYAYTFYYYANSDICLTSSQDKTTDLGVPPGSMCITPYLPLICEQGLCLTLWASSFGSSTIDIQPGICPDTSTARICSDFCLYATPEGVNLDECNAWTNTTSFRVTKRINGGFIALVIFLPLGLFLLCFWRYHYNKSGHCCGCLEVCCGGSKRHSPASSSSSSRTSNDDDDERGPSALDIMYGGNGGSTKKTKNAVSDIPHKGGNSTTVTTTITTKNPLSTSPQSSMYPPSGYGGGGSYPPASTGYPPLMMNNAYPPPVMTTNGGGNGYGGGYGGGNASPYRL